MSLIARLMDQRNRTLLSGTACKKETQLEDTEKYTGELYKDGVYTNGIQGL